MKLWKNIYCADYSRLNNYILSKGYDPSSKDIEIKDDKKLLFDKYDSIPSELMLLPVKILPKESHGEIQMMKKDFSIWKSK